MEESEVVRFILSRDKRPLGSSLRIRYLYWVSSTVLNDVIVCENVLRCNKEARSRQFAGRRLLFWCLFTRCRFMSIERRMVLHIAI